MNAQIDPNHVVLIASLIGAGAAVVGQIVAGIFSSLKSILDGRTAKNNKHLEILLNARREVYLRAAVAIGKIQETVTAIAMNTGADDTSSFGLLQNAIADISAVYLIASEPTINKLWEFSESVTLAVQKITAMKIAERIQSERIPHVPDRSTMNRQGQLDKMIIVRRQFSMETIVSLGNLVGQCLLEARRDLNIKTSDLEFIANNNKSYNVAAKSLGDFLESIRNEDFERYYK